MVSALGLTVGQLTWADPNPPQDVEQTIIIPPGGFCAFAVELSASGKAKTVILPRGRVLLTSPGLDARLTNLDDPSKQITLNVTGASHVTTEQDGSLVTVITGRNLAGDPEAGLVLAIGNFSFIFDASGNLIQPLAGEGQLIDVCALIA